MTNDLHPVVLDLIQEAGALSQALGLGRNPGQVYAYLFLNEGPRTLAEIQDALAISKGSVSMVTRQLEQFEAVRKVWVKGDRKDYYEANDWLGRVLKNVMSDTIGQRLANADQVLSAAGEVFVGEDAPAYLKARVTRLQRFSGRLSDVWNNPLLKVFVQ